MTGFKEGQKVRRVKGGIHVGMKVGDVGTVASVIRDGGNLIIEEFQQPGWSHAAENFELVEPATPQWSDVEPGDKVTFRDTTDDTQHMAIATGRGSGGSVLVLGAYTGSILTRDTRELLSIEKPKPQPPTTPGSHVTVPHPYWESGINHLFLLDEGRWQSQTGAAFWTPESVADKDFTVIHDAGAQS